MMNVYEVFFCFIFMVIENILDFCVILKYVIVCIFWFVEEWLEFLYIVFYFICVVSNYNYY